MGILGRKIRQNLIGCYSHPEFHSTVGVENFKPELKCWLSILISLHNGTIKWPSTEQTAAAGTQSFLGESLYYIILYSSLQIMNNANDC